MGEAYYRIGQAAKLLGISSYHLRRLCELGLVEAEYSGHQWRILVSEAEKLQRQGVPPIPSGEIVPHESNGARSGQRLLAPPSASATNSAEEALMSEHELTIARNKTELLENQVKSLGLKREMEEQQDWFRQRTAQEAQREAEERRRQAEASAQRRQSEWRDKLLELALEKIPPDAPPETRQRTISTIETALSQLESTRSERVVQYEMDAALERGLAEWRRRQQEERAIDAAVERLPRVPGIDISDSARQTAAQAIAQLGDNATHFQIERVEERALAPMRDGLAHMERCRKCADWAVLDLRDATWDERDQAVAAVWAALNKLPARCSDAEMRHVQDAEIKRIQAEILKRRTSEKGEEERKQKAAAQQWLIGGGLSEIYRTLKQLERNWVLPKSAWTLDKELKPVIHAQLEKELAGDESRDEVAQLVRRLTRRAVGIR